jgi:hypothetical protein
LYTAVAAALSFLSAEANVVPVPRISVEGIPTEQEDLDELPLDGHLYCQLDVISGDVVFV